MTFEILKSGRYHTVAGSVTWAIWSDDARMFVAWTQPAPWWDEKIVQIKGE